MSTTTPTVVLTSALRIAMPVGAGMLIGVGVRRVCGRHRRGAESALVLLLVPAALVVAAFVRVPIVGLWDAACEGLLLGSGVLVAAHRAFDGGREIALSIAALVSSLVLLEVAVRCFLPAAPAFPSSAGVHLGLRDAIHAAGETQAADPRRAVG